MLLSTVHFLSVIAIPTSMTYLSLNFRRRRQHPTPPISNLDQGCYRQVRIRSTYSASSIVSQSNSIPRSQPINGIFHPQASMCANNYNLTILSRVSTSVGLRSMDLELPYPRHLITMSADLWLSSTDVELPYPRCLVTTSVDLGLPSTDLEFPYSRHLLATSGDLRLPWIDL